MYSPTKPFQNSRTVLFLIPGLLLLVLLQESYVDDNVVQSDDATLEVGRSNVVDEPFIRPILFQLNKPGERSGHSIWKDNNLDKVFVCFLNAFNSNVTGSSMCSC